MARNRRNAGFTLIELLVVVAIIALLISMLLPSLQMAREEGKKAVCLSNMRSLSTSTAAYASEDKREPAVPIQQQMVKKGFGNGFSGGNSWALRSALPFVYGGRTAQKPFAGTTTIMMDDNGRWAARTRPLNRYVYHGVDTSDSKKMEMYRCPSDTGYPNSPFVYDAPSAECDGSSCYDMFGNSIRFNFAGVFYPSTNASDGEFSVGPYGHRISTLQNTGRQTNLMEPLFYSMTIQAAQVGSLPAELLLRGWHKRIMTANVGFVDGSARPTRVQDLNDFDATTLVKMNLAASYRGSFRSFLRRGQTWQMDCYPTPGAYVPKYDNAGNQAVDDSQISSGGPGWPFDAFQKNFSPP